MALPDGFWSTIVDGLSGFVLVLNGDFVCTYVSSGVAEVLQVQPAELIGRRPESWLDADQLPALWHGRVEAAWGDPAVDRVRARRADGTDRWLELVHRALPDPTDHTATVVVVQARDVTAETDLLARLSRSEQRYQQLLQTVDDAVIQIDTRLRIESFNSQALELLGVEAGDLLGRPAFEAIALCSENGEPLPTPPPEVMADLKEHGRAEVWRTVQRHDGSRLLLRVRWLTFEGPHPGTGGMVAVLQNALDPRLAGERPMPDRDRARAAAGFTAREGDVLDGLASGGDVPTIAGQLGISVHSVRGHVKSITAKLGVHSQLQAVIAAARRGMVDLDQPWTPPTRER
jgi:PAS domain S-box-containing protein